MKNYKVILSTKEIDFILAATDLYRSQYGSARFKHNQKLVANETSPTKLKTIFSLLHKLDDKSSVKCSTTRKKIDSHWNDYSFDPVPETGCKHPNIIDGYFTFLPLKRAAVGTYLWYCPDCGKGHDKIKDFSKT